MDDTVGQLQPNFEAMVVNEKGEPLGTKQSGEICIRAPFIMTGYYKEPEQTARVLTQDNWLKTEDIGWVDDHGNWYVVGRNKVCKTSHAPSWPDMLRAKTGTGSFQKRQPYRLWN